jgi:hypothetical protein
LEDLTKKFTHRYDVISTQMFLKKEALVGEVPFLISAYDQRQEVEVTNSIKLLRNKLETNAIYPNCEKIQLSQSSDGKTLVVNTFQLFIKTVYVKLRILGFSIFSEDTYKQVVLGRMDSLFVNNENTIGEAESEILNIINRRKRQHDRTSLNDAKTKKKVREFDWIDVSQIR